MTWIPPAGVVPVPVDLGLVGGPAWALLAAVAAAPAAVMAAKWFEIGVIESIHALVDLVASDRAHGRLA